MCFADQKVPLHQLKQLEKQLNEKLTEEVEHARHELTDKLEEIQSEKMQLSSRLLSTEKDLQHVFDEEKRHKRIVEEKQKVLIFSYLMLIIGIEQNLKNIIMYHKISQKKNRKKEYSK